MAFGQWTARQWVNSSPPGQNGRHFADNIFRCIFVSEKFSILMTISLQFVPKGPIDNNRALVKIMAWRRIEATSHYLNQCWPDSHIYGALGGEELKSFPCYQVYGRKEAEIVGSTQKDRNIQFDVWLTKQWSLDWRGGGGLLHISFFSAHFNLLVLKPVYSKTRYIFHISWVSARKT